MEFVVFGELTLYECEASLIRCVDWAKRGWEP